ncbi:hypothetical protein DWB84_03550 [Saccharophagus sp. K07]|nr:hypothetical protein [Saccharophagus sp. K07]
MTNFKLFASKQDPALLRSLKILYFRHLDTDFRSIIQESVVMCFIQNNVMAERPKKMEPQKYVALAGLALFLAAAGVSKDRR